MSEKEGLSNYRKKKSNKRDATVELEELCSLQERKKMCDNKYESPVTIIISILQINRLILLLITALYIYVHNFFLNRGWKTTLQMKLGAVIFMLRIIKCPWKIHL